MKKNTIIGLSLAAILGVTIFLGLRANHQRIELDSTKSDSPTFSKRLPIGLRANHQRIELDSTKSDSPTFSKRLPNGIAQQTKSGQKQSTSLWEIWVDEQTDAVMKSYLKVVEANGEKRTSEEIAVWRDRFRAKLSASAEELKNQMSSPPPIVETPEVKYERTALASEGPKKHDGLQTVDALMATFLMATFDDDYNASLSYPAMAEVDEKYPRDEWLARLLDNGLHIGDYSDYSLYMNERANLSWLEGEPERWASGKIKGVPPTDDWETFESAYIDRKIWEFRQIYEAKQEDPRVVGGLFTGPDDRTFLPYSDGRVYVERFETGAFFFGEELSDKQQLNLMLYGNQPAGYDIVYINENGSILSEPPPPPRPTEEQRQQYKAWLEAQQNSPSERPVDATDGWDNLDSLREYNYGYTDTPHISPQAAQGQFERAEAEALERAAMTDAEMETALEEQFVPETVKENRKQVTEDEIETGLNERFSPERLQQAQQILGQYSPEEGLDRLREVDPEIAERIARKRNRGNREQEPKEDEPTR